MLVKVLVPHYTSEGRYVPEGGTIDVPAKDLNPWQIPAEPAAQVAMDAKFAKDKSGVQYKRGTL